MVDESIINIKCQLVLVLVQSDLPQTNLNFRTGNIQPGQLMCLWGPEGHLGS